MPPERATAHQRAAPRLRCDAFALMRQLGPERFNMDHWFVDLPDAEVHHRRVAVQPGNPCGTAACLAGTAVLGMQDPGHPLHRRPPVVGRESHAGPDLRNTLGLSVGYLDTAARPGAAGSTSATGPATRSTNCTAAGPCSPAQKASTASTSTASTSTAGQHEAPPPSRVRSRGWVLDDIVHGNRMHWWDPVRCEPNTTMTDANVIPIARHRRVAHQRELRQLLHGAHARLDGRPTGIRVSVTSIAASCSTLSSSVRRCASIFGWQL